MRARTRKIERLAALLSALTPEEIHPGAMLLSGEPRQGRIGIGGAMLRRLESEGAAQVANVNLLELDEAFTRVQAATGRGSVAERERILGELFTRLTAAERDFVVRLLMGGLRQGALEGVLIEALARAGSVSAGTVRRAMLFAGNVGEVAATLLTEGEAGLQRFALELFRPLRPMLADSAENVSDAWARAGAAAVEYKLDGARIQVHRKENDVRVYTRQGHDVTSSVPELVEGALALPVREVVLDGEAIAFGTEGRPLPFQTTMRRFGRRLNVEALSRELPLTSMFFDCLQLDGQELVDRPNRERVAALTERVPAASLIMRREVTNEEQIDEFLGEALQRGHEGVLVKGLDSPYDAGRRGASWLKLKPAHTLDLVVLAVEWGSGRRTGLLSNLHLGARDPANGGFVMLGKTFKGLTDAMLAFQTEKLGELATEHEGHVVHVRPELVVEIAFDGVQQSPHYPGGLALRFARVKSYRTDKRAEEADTVETVRAIFERGR